MKIQNQKSKQQSSGEPALKILPCKCVFCNKSDKYMKNTKNKKILTNCVQLRADEGSGHLQKTEMIQIITIASDKQLIV